LIISKCDHLYKSSFGLEPSGVCINTIPWRKDISNDLRKAIVAAINMQRVIWPFSKQFEVHYSNLQ